MTTSSFTIKALISKKVYCSEEEGRFWSTGRRSLLLCRSCQKEKPRSVGTVSLLVRGCAAGAPRKFVCHACRDIAKEARQKRLELLTPETN